MADSIVWLHEDALRITHPAVKAAPNGTCVIYIWDDTYLQAAGYSLKRLVFLYETLCAMPLQIHQGDTVKTLKALDSANLYVPATLNPSLQEIIRVVSLEKNVRVIPEEPFVTLNDPKDFTRFFSYWKKAEKTAFVTDGNKHA